jgi:hypothetical protein
LSFFSYYCTVHCTVGLNEWDFPAVILSSKLSERVVVLSCVPRNLSAALPYLTQTRCRPECPEPDVLRDAPACTVPDHNNNCTRDNKPRPGTLLCFSSPLSTARTLTNDASTGLQVALYPAASCCAMAKRKARVLGDEGSADHPRRSSRRVSTVAKTGGEEVVDARDVSDIGTF